MKIETQIHLAPTDTAKTAWVHEAYLTIGGSTLTPNEQAHFHKIAHGTFTISDVWHMVDVVQARSDRLAIAPGIGSLTRCRTFRNTMIIHADRAVCLANKFLSSVLADLDTAHEFYPTHAPKTGSDNETTRH